MTTFQDIENFVVEILPDKTDAVLQAYRAANALEIQELPNISKVLKSNIWAIGMPAGFPTSEMNVPGVFNVEGEVEHGFFQRPQDLFDPLPDSLIDEAPLGRFGLTLGSVASQSQFAASGDLDSILETIQAPQAWRTNRGEGATIVIIDSGIDGRRVPEYRRAGSWSGGGGDPWQDDFGHGTMVALIAAANERDVGFNGVAPGAKIFSMKPKVGPSGGIQGTSVLKGLDHLLGLDLGPVVTNQSWGVFGCSSPLMSCKVIAARLVHALNQGAVTVWAAGNNKDTCGQLSTGTLWCMNSLPDSVSVGALDRKLAPQAYSSPGPGQ